MYTTDIKYFVFRFSEFVQTLSSHALHYVFEPKVQMSVAKFFQYLQDVTSRRVFGRLHDWLAAASYSTNALDCAQIDFAIRALSRSRSVQRPSTSSRIASVSDNDVGAAAAAAAAELRRQQKHLQQLVGVARPRSGS